MWQVFNGFQWDIHVGKPFRRSKDHVKVTNLFEAGWRNWNGPSALEQPTATWRVLDQLLTAQQTVPTPCFSEAVDTTRLRHTKSVGHVWTISSHQLCSEQYLDASNASKLDITKSDLKAMFKHQAFSPRCDLPTVDSIRSIAFFLGTWRFAQSKNHCAPKKTWGKNVKRHLLAFVGLCTEKKSGLLASHLDGEKRIWLNSNKDMWV